ncbi:MAG TPA: GNAT family N-acetyltransferase [Candidatus Acidoferrales bacterium]|nr:GNAT family N-acetyltransferase [Candidatus Acidoferrales bacterium]
MYSSSTVEIDSKWDELLKTMPGWNVFQLSDWLRLYVSSYFSGATIRGVLLHEGTELIGMTPVVMWKKFGFSMAGSPLRHALTPYMGIACKRNPEACVSAFAQYCSAQGVRMATLTLSFFLPDTVVTHNHFRVKTRMTSVIDLSEDLDTILKKMDGKTRNQLRQGEKNGLEVSFDIDDKSVNQYLGLRSRLYTLQGMDQSTSSTLMESFFSSFPKEYYALFSVKYEGAMIAAAVLLKYAETCLYWDGVSDAQFNRLRPNNVLQWQVIKWAKASGIHWYDLGGTNTPSIAHFKKGFGGIEKTYTSVEMFSPAFLGSVWKVFEKLRARKNPRLKGAM